MQSSSGSAPAPISLHIITGFLGSGKTTVLNTLLQDKGLDKTIVIVNEFGDIGIDHDLIVNTEDNMLLLSSGCLCCTIRDDLVKTLEDLLRRRDNNRIAAFERVLIETTGLADPVPILYTIMSHKYLNLRYSLQGIITVFDALNGAETIRVYEEAYKQIAVADRIVVTKRDLVSAQDYESIIDTISQINPSAHHMDAESVSGSRMLLLNSGPFRSKTQTPDIQDWLNTEAFKPVEHNHKEHHHNIPTNHDSLIESFCFSSDVPVSRNAYNLFIELLSAVHGDKLLRVKGIVYLRDQPDQPVIVQGAQRFFHPPVSLDAWPFAERCTKLVFIVRDMRLETIEKLWSALTSVP